MTRAAHVTQPVSAMRKGRAAPRSLSEPASMTFLVYEDNAGRYRWTIVADGSETLVRSASFGSYEEAKHAARIVHRGASQASFEDRSGDTPPLDLPARRDPATARDRLDAERWLDEGGSFSSFSTETVTR
jgi:uncharacterized protein YegP (UPF0339 family)